MKLRDIVVGLFRLAGLEEDEDLLYACTMDVRLMFFFFGVIAGMVQGAPWMSGFFLFWSDCGPWCRVYHGSGKYLLC